MDNITIDGMEEMEFRRSIESMLRHGQADDAADKLKTLLASYAGEGRILPERFLSVNAGDIRLEGWDQLGEKLGEYDRPEVPMSAISIDILDPQGVGARPDDGGCLKPVMETSYFSDSAYPFSEADREDLLDGYSSFGCEWQGNFENVDTIISVEGIDDLYGATVGLENKVASSSKAELADIQAGSVGSCYLAVLIHQAIRDAVREKGLPRPICVLSGSNDAYPFFDAPAMTAEEYRMANGLEAAPDLDTALASGDEFDDAAPQGVGGMASLESLMGLGAKKKEKQPVLTIAPDEADTVESLEMPVEVLAEGDDRQHIMPALDLAEGPPPEGSFQPGESPIAEQWEDMGHAPLAAEPAPPLDFEAEQPAMPIDFGMEEPAKPIEFDSRQPTARVDFGTEMPTVSIDFGSGHPAAPIEFEADEPAAPIDFDDGNVPQEPPLPLDLGGFEPFEPEDYEPQAPLKRLSSDTAGPEVSIPVPRSPLAEPEAEEQSGNWDNDPGIPEVVTARSLEEFDAPTPGDPLDFSAESDADAPLDLEEFAAAGEPQPEDWGQSCDLPAVDETGDNLPWPSGGPKNVGQHQTEEPKPARHAIRVIAASVTNDGKGRKPRAGHHGPSLLVRPILGIGAACNWLWTRIVRR